MKNSKYPFIISAFLVISLSLSSCGSLLKQAEEAVQGDYGPTYSTQEHQTRTFNALWNDLAQYYIYHDSDKVNWDTLQKEYLGRIESGLTDKQFVDLLHELETKLPAGALLYQSRSERLEVDTADFSTYEGIGAIVGFQEKEVPHVVILDVIDGSPAEQAGLKPHDSIFQIDGSPVLQGEGLTVVNRIRGPAGSSVTLDVKTPGKEARSIKVTRGKLTSTGKLEASLIPGTHYGYLLFPAISYTGMLDDVTASLQKFTTNQKMEGLILDLRVAGSSRGWPLEDLLTLFHNGKIGEFYNNAKQTQPVVITGKDSFSSQSVPLIVLIGQNTNGFPEILAASLQVGNRATIIGEPTIGAIETTNSFYLPDGSRIFIEIASFRLPNGDDIGISGVQPDVTVAAGWDDILPNADPVLDKAVELLKEKK